MLREIKEKVLNGGEIGRAEALRLADEDLDGLCAAADEVRRAFHGDDFDFCAIVNARSGRCSENCRFCAQSAFYHTGAPEYGLLPAETILADAKKKEAAGIPRYSLVTSGRTLSDADVEAVCEATRLILAETKLSVCLSAGLLRREQFERLKEAGLTRFHNNLETSRRFFPSVCTTHSYDDKIAALENASAAGLEICSGGILGLGETMEDRIDMCLDLRALGVRSTPMNVLSAIPGTPFESLPKLTNDEFCRTVAIFRLVNPRARLRLAGGRSVLGDDGERAFRSGADAAITDDMLTTSGVACGRDRALVERLGFRPHGFLRPNRADS
ncbi:MAG: biotin synthase BioB [Fibrobacterales bacterium]|nr:biotin synthase BioB [Fibrobacterales bacterium]